MESLSFYIRTISRQIIFLLIILSLTLPSSAQGALVDLGTYGKTYEISEKSMDEWIREQLSEFDFEALKKSHFQKVQSYRPETFDFPRAENPNVRYYNPEVVLKSPIRDHKGEILLPAGYRDNPLHYTRLTSKIIIFDGTDPAQIAFVHAVSQKKKTLPILTKGDFARLTAKLDMRLYYANETILERLAIKKVPTVIYQESKESLVLRVEEIVL